MVVALHVLFTYTELCISMKYPEDGLNQFLATSAKKLRLGLGWIFQEDNDPKHTLKPIQK